MIEMVHLTKRFDADPALEDVSLTIPSGSAFGLLGSNGAGKSTLLRLLAGIYRQDSGTLTLDGAPVYDHVPSKERVFFINDETVQFSQFTLKGLKDYYRDFYPRFSQELFDKLHSLVKLPMEKPIGRFSKGMKRQAIVITGLACQTDFLLLDEAFDGLDPTMRIIVKQMLVDAILDRKLTVIISSHNLAEINEICDRAALLHQGKILFCKELDSLSENIHKVQAAFAVDHEDSAFAPFSPLHISRLGSIYTLIVRGEEQEIRKKLEEYRPLVLDMVPLTLEEVFLYEMEGLGYSGDISKELASGWTENTETPLKNEPEGRENAQ